jgi:DNA-binding Xre family transcriptional regulator
VKSRKRSRLWVSGINKEEASLKISYKPLWKLLIDKDLKKKDLCEMAGISPASVTKMGKCGHVTTETLEKICLALDCGVEDVMELLPEEQSEEIVRAFEMEVTM